MLPQETKDVKAVHEVSERIPCVSLPVLVSAHFNPVKQWVMDKLSQLSVAYESFL